MDEDGGVNSLDLNADVGEGFPHDAALLALISSANVACGFHAGDQSTMRWLCALCAEHDVAVGAQVSYRDRAGFGRRRVDIEYDALLADVREQCEALDDAAAASGLAVSYVKPHGALYHRVVDDEEQARAVLDATPGLPVLGLPGSSIVEQAKADDRRTVHEFFADRAYRSDGTLVDRWTEGAVVADPVRVRERVRRLVVEESVVAVDGSVLKMRADSVCVHGDTEGALGLAREIAAVLTAQRVTIRRFV
jgi:UPF0271 protein